MPNIVHYKAHNFLAQIVIGSDRGRRYDDEHCFQTLEENHNVIVLRLAESIARRQLGA